MTANYLYERLLVGALGLGMGLGIAGCRSGSGPDSPESKVKAIRSLEPAIQQKTNNLSAVVLQANAHKQYEEALRLKGVNEALCNKAKLGDCVYPEGDVTFTNVMGAITANVHQVLQSSSVDDDPAVLDDYHQGLLTVTIELAREAQQFSTPVI